MYSHEIQNQLEKHSYSISSNEYIDICTNSPQIELIKYNPYSNRYTLSTDDGYAWEFEVKAEGTDYGKT